MRVDAKNAPWSLAWVQILAISLLATGCGLSRRSTTPPPHATTPAFSLPDTTGKQRSLSALAEGGKAVVVFYRGHW